MKRLTILFGLLLAACTTISHRSPPSDWPRLTIIEHRMKAVEVLQKCYDAVPLWLKLLGAIPEGCAYIDFATMRCDIYIHELSKPGERVYEHELEHCAGRDHNGATDLSDYWEAWKARMLTGADRYYYVRHDGVTVAAVLKPIDPPTVLDVFKQKPQFDPPKRQETIFD